ncbi:site-specific integrase [Prauserella alba]|uniref:Tyr recombinase domain-containing protein n=1 Tax=Prauserella alba TaxID=176898 RepID=A0ABN1VFT9_9PSEU|nr:tyrosine-type recombinase/integrase [Prauserella alba]MCP2183041.1 Phage integrase family protein [Prauserella alba]
MEKAFDLDEAWGTLVWLVMTTGMRRGEVCALRWSRVELDEGVVDVRSSYTTVRGIGKEKDTKTHQIRRIALDTETVGLLRERKKRCQELFGKLEAAWDEESFVFTGARGGLAEPSPPDAVSNRCKKMSTGLGIKTHLHALRHYSATELLTADVDLRTVAGRLGHGGGGATTLRVYAAWVAAADRKAAEILGARMPKRLPKGPNS